MVFIAMRNHLRYQHSLGESVWYWLVPQNHRDLFLRLPGYSLTIRSCETGPS